MFHSKNTKGFTLIELLVVITIIGILAVGGTTVYTSQIQKARDTTRLNDVKAFQGAVEQVFADVAGYPEVGVSTPVTAANCTSANAANTNVSCIVSLGFMASLPRDPKSTQQGNLSPLDYTYNVGPVGGVVQQSYEISTGVENSGNLTSKAANTADGGNDANRYEVGNGVSTLKTSVIAAGAAGAATDNSVAVLIAATRASCQSVSGAQAAAGTTAVGGTQIVIKGNCQ